jgi:nucleotide-binding universal stress UspA family protein
MTQIVVPVRYPLSEHSRATLAEAIEIAEERGGSLTILHINLYQNGRQVSRSELKRAVESEFGHLPDARYSVRSGLLVEETILDEIASEETDIVVIGKKQAGRWRKMLQRITDDPDVETYLRDRVNCEIVTVSPEL